MTREWADKIFNVEETGFDALALEIFRFQYENNSLYKAYADLLGADPAQVKSISAIPFLPISFFKTHPVKTTEFEPEIVFESSGTSSTVNSHHLVKQTDLYRQSFLKSFEIFYGDLTGWCIIGLLPSYLERKNSSLVFMVDEWIRKSGHPQSGFYLTEFDQLQRVLSLLESQQQKTLLIGVSYALLDFAESFPIKLKNTVVMETGGMKGRREELIKKELHEILKSKFQADAIHSEYGMTELLSQAYSNGQGIFRCPPWMKVVVRDEEDPRQVISAEELRARFTHLASRIPHPASRNAHPASRITDRGIINVIDLANIYSCSFIATDDAGKLNQDGSFELLGRVDNSDIRGCSLMVG